MDAAAADCSGEQSAQAAQLGFLQALSRLASSGSLIVPDSSTDCVPESLASRLSKVTVPSVRLTLALLRLLPSLTKE
ncbi:hypothetical protein D3C79_1068890 [compost metagenome]